MTTARSTRTHRWTGRIAAASYLGVSPRTIDNLTARGDLTVHKLPGSRLVFLDLDEIDEALERGAIDRTSGR